MHRNSNITRTLSKQIISCTALVTTNALFINKIHEHCLVTKSHNFCDVDVFFSVGWQFLFFLLLFFLSNKTKWSSKCNNLMCGRLGRSAFSILLTCQLVLCQSQSKLLSMQWQCSILQHTWYTCTYDCRRRVPVLRLQRREVTVATSRCSGPEKT